MPLDLKRVETIFHQALGKADPNERAAAGCADGWDEDVTSWHGQLAHGACTHARRWYAIDKSPSAASFDGMELTLRSC